MIALKTHLILGRVSNLPTVWTNALAGAALSGSWTAFDGAALGALLLALTLFYIGGMYLNDAFDAEIDAEERSVRPIPTGLIARELVFTLGFGFLLVGALIGFSLGWQTGLAGLGLAGAIFLYDWLHKRTVLSPVIMGACRFLTYVMAALAAGDLTGAVLIGAFGLFAHTVGLTYAAKQEAYDRLDRLWPLAVLAVPAVIGAWLAMTTQSAAAPIAAFLVIYVAWGLWSLRYLFRRQAGDIGRGVISLIAAISLFDAVMIASTGASLLAVLAVIGFGLTLLFQKVVPGT